MQVKHLEVP